MSPEQVTDLMAQHTQMLLQLERIWTAFIILVFLGLIFFMAMIFTAVWSVRTVIRRQMLTEAKWNTLVDLLVHNARHAGS